MTVEQRLERLERQNRWMRRIGTVGISAVAVAMLARQGREEPAANGVVRRDSLESRRRGDKASEYVILGADRKNRARLGIWHGHMVYAYPPVEERAK